MRSDTRPEAVLADATFACRDEFTRWPARGRSLDDANSFRPPQSEPPVGRPAQIFAIGLNYRAHVSETGIRPQITSPTVSTKFATSAAGPYRADGGPAPPGIP
ncbi:hypothetical protein [Streptomyces niveus]|uniref:hypothetical protein n=1 Tax=Streptomyces niveus TaxID=193462 RepID=UPI003628A7B0